jgi:hypothetical protein
MIAFDDEAWTLMMKATYSGPLWVVAAVEFGGVVVVAVDSVVWWQLDVGIWRW